MINLEDKRWAIIIGLILALIAGFIIITILRI